MTRRFLSIASFVPFVPFVSFVSFVPFVSFVSFVLVAAAPSKGLDQAFNLAYNLDYADAVTVLEKAVAEQPDDADVHRAIAITAWLRVGFLRGSVTVDDYMGSVSKPNINMLPPPEEEAERFHRHITRAIELAEAGTRQRPNDTDALFRLGAAVGAQASYAATVEGKILGSLRAARRAYDAHERVLALDPSRKDAGLVVGTYRYMVSALSFPMRVMAYVVGFGGGKERGIQLIEAAADYPSATQNDARFALLLIYNREKRYDDALRVIRKLQELFPRNRQLWYEAGATLIRAGRYAEAESVLSKGIRQRDDDPRERMFGEDALWHYKRGLARARLNRGDAARADLQVPIEREARDWVRGRANAELGLLAAKAGDAEQARRHYRLAIELAARGNDPNGQAEAEWLLKELR